MKNVLALTIIAFWITFTVIFGVYAFNAARSADLLWFSLNLLGLAALVWFASKSWYESEHKARAREALLLLEEARDIKARREGIRSDG